MKKCYDCYKKVIKGKLIFCKPCKKKRDEGKQDTKGSATLIIYNTI